MLEFTNDVVVTKTYKTSVKDFMDNYFHECTVFKGDLDIYVQNNIARGYMNRVFCIPLLSNELGLDFDDKENVAKVLRRYSKENNNG